MAVTVAIRFPLGRYHATAWDHSVNEGVVEWPPSPWRLLRAIVATWYTRWPDLPAPTLDSLLDALGDPPCYSTPPTRPSHTRHYLPDPHHYKGQAGATDLTLDPYLSIRRNDELLVRWETQLSHDQWTTLEKLVELMPYLGRADSLCDARLLPDDPVPDEFWWRPGTGSAETVRLLAPVAPVRRPILEMSTVDVRRARRTIPPETTWIPYTRTTPKQAPAAQRPVPKKVRGIRLAVVSQVPVKATHGILLADEVHRRAALRLGRTRTGELFGHGGAATDHQHAHWIPITNGPQPGATVESLLIWVPDGLTPDQVEAILAIREVTGQRRGRRDGEEGYEVKGLPPTRLLLQAAGDISQVAPDLCSPARRWRTWTPYLPVRHRKRESLDDYLTKDVRAELGYRGLPPATVARVDPDDGLSDRWARDFRRYRMKENLGMARRGLGLRLEFPDPVPGPILLGQLSHFGYGAFLPESD